MQQVRILGTSHISRQSAKEIQEAFDEFRPDIVAVELDRQRLQSLQQRQSGQKQSIPLSMIRQVGVTGYLFLVIGSYVQRKLAGVVRVEPGIDMLTAIKIAGEHKKRVLLIDQHILVTMARMRKLFTFREKLRLIWDVFTAPFQRQKLEIDLNKVPSKKVINKLLKHMHVRYPGLYQALITDRNIHMEKQLKKYAEAHPEERILLVIGAGHEDDLRARLSTS